jgi:uncharacterized DUF497 family protein
VRTRFYTWNEAKRELNVERHNIDFSAADDFDWDSAIVREDIRRDYGEQRFIAYGRIGSRLHVLVFTPRSGMRHIISLRKANEREIRRYGKVR